MSILTDTTQSGCVTFEAFHEQYYTLVKKRAFYLLKNREDAEDVTQETFLKAARYWGKADKTKNLRAWLWTIVTRTACDFVRHRNIQVSACSLETLLHSDGEEYLTVLSSLVDPEPGSLDMLIAHETMERVIAETDRASRCILGTIQHSNHQREAAQNIMRVEHRFADIATIYARLREVQTSFIQRYQEQEVA